MRNISLGAICRLSPVIWIVLTNMRDGLLFAINHHQPSSLIFIIFILSCYTLYSLPLLFSEIFSFGNAGEMQKMYCIHYATSGKIHAKNRNVKMRQTLNLVLVRNPRTLFYYFTFHAFHRCFMSSSGISANSIFIAQMERRVCLCYFKCKNSPLHLRDGHNKFK